MICVGQRQAKKRTMTLSARYIAGTAFLTAEYLRPSGAWRKADLRMLERILSQMRKQGVREVCVEDGVPWETAMKKYAMARAGHLALMRACASRVALMLLQEDTAAQAIPLVYAAEPGAGVLRCTGELCRACRDVCICFGRSSEKIRRQLMDEYGIAPLLEEAVPMGRAMAVCFDAPAQERILRWRPVLLVNACGRKIESRFPIVSDVRAECVEWGIPDGTDVTAVLSAVLQEKPTLAGRVVLSKIIPEVT